MRPIIGLDWGTSSLRVVRFDQQGGIQEERSLPRGILTVAAGEFPDVFAQATAQWPGSDDALYLISGMAGSRQGWVEAPYLACPAGFADLATALTWVEQDRIAIVPGLSFEQQDVPDVMRGEETQVFGAMQLLQRDHGLFVLPGTHSKWVRVERGHIESFSTFMTGEFYALLRQHSILARTMPTEDGELNEEAFERGVRQAVLCANLLNAAFSARTLSLFERMPAQALPSYLSGLVIGEELRSQQLHLLAEPVVIVGSPSLARRYELALRLLDVRCVTAGPQAAWRGLWGIACAL